MKLSYDFLLSDGEVTERMDQEATIMQTVRHANVVQFFGAGMLADGRPFMVMELMELGSLDHMLSDQSIPDCHNGQPGVGMVLDWVTKVRFALETARGMALVHSLNRMHRDLKSANVLVTAPHGILHVKVADFGLARLSRSRRYGKDNELKNVVDIPHIDVERRVQGRGAHDLHDPGKAKIDERKGVTITENTPLLQSHDDDNNDENPEDLSGAEAYAPRSWKGPLRHEKVAKSGQSAAGGSKNTDKSGTSFAAMTPVSSRVKVRSGIHLSAKDRSCSSNSDIAGSETDNSMIGGNGGSGSGSGDKGITDLPESTPLPASIGVAITPTLPAAVQTAQLPGPADCHDHDICAKVREVEGFVLIDKSDTLVDEVDEVAQWDGRAGKKKDKPTSRAGTIFWMAPEVLAGDHYDKSADVFSFGILMWEIASRQKPWKDHLRVRNCRGLLGNLLQELLQRGERPHADTRWPARYVHCMRQCWSFAPSERPTFSEVVSILSNLAGLQNPQQYPDPYHSTRHLV